MISSALTPATAYPPLTTPPMPKASWPSRHAAGGTIREERRGDDGREVRARPLQLDLDVRAVRPQADLRGVGDPTGEVVAGAADVDHQGRERCRPDRVDDPQPAADDVGGGQRRPVGERQVRAEVEDDAPAVIGDVPAARERGLQREARVERGERLVQLGGHGGGRDVDGRGRVERRGLPDEDPDLVRVGRVDPDARAVAQDPAGDDQRGPGQRRSGAPGRGTLSGAPPVERPEGPAFEDPRLEAALDRDGDPGAHRGDVAVARETEQEGDDAGPLTHGREYAAGR